MALPMAIGKAVGSAIGQVGIQLALEKAFFNKDVKNTVKSTESAFAKGFDNVEKKSNKTFGAIGGIIKTAFTVVGVGAVTKFVKTAVDAASETQAAWTGLNSILTGTGKSFAEGKEFIEEYISDGLVPLQNAVTAYKNLAARGYSTEQIEKTMLALKDAAAFGRQASYSYGEAIQTATEGLKNENSILVDNAGVTKNVAKMWDEYAASIGTTANNLTQQQKIQAEVNGILAETKFQAGDAAAYADTFAGKVARINTAFYNFKVAVGKFVAPIAELFLPYIEMALNALTRFFNKMGQILKVFGLEMPDVVSKTSTSIANVGTSAATAADGISNTGTAAEKAAKKIKRAFAGVDEINVLNTSDNSSGNSGGSSGSGSDSGLAGGGGASNDITEIGEVTESVNSSASKIANKIKELFEPLKKIDFTNLISAFDKLKEAAAPLTEKLFKGLEWLWYNVLVPFTTWTIEDAIPAFFKALAGALDFLNGVLDYAKPYLIFLWDEILQPIASWTGGVIVDVLEWIGDKLSIIGKWLSKNAPTIESVAKELSPFSDLLGEMAKALGNILGLAWSAFTSIISNLWEKALKPLWEYLLKPLLTQYWGQLQGLAEILGGIFGAFNKMMEGDWKGAGIAIWEGLRDGIVEIWDGSFVKRYLYDPIVGGFKKLFGIESPSTVFKEFGINIIEGIGEGLLNMKKWIVEKWNTVKGWFSDITKEAKVKISQKWSDIKEKWTNLTKNIQNKTADMKAKIASKWSDLSSKWTSITKNIKNKTVDMKARVATTWSNLKTKWTTLMSNFKDKTVEIKAKIGNVIGSFKDTINEKIIKPINKKLPNFFPQIPYLAQGSWFAKNNPTLAVVGDNKHEPEIVAPESKIYNQAKKAVEDAGTTNNNQHFDFTIKLEYPDGKYLIKEINNAQIKDGKISLLV